MLSSARGCDVDSNAWLSIGTKFEGVGRGEAEDKSSGTFEEDDEKETHTHKKNGFVMQEGWALNYTNKWNT
jgi:hypothetical protein